MIPWPALAEKSPALRRARFPSRPGVRRRRRNRLVRGADSVHAAGPAVPIPALPASAQWRAGALEQHGGGPNQPAGTVGGAAGEVGHWRGTSRLGGIPVASFSDFLLANHPQIMFHFSHEREQQRSSGSFMACFRSTVYCALTPKKIISMTVSEFIEQVYIKEIGAIQQSHDYLAISLMMTGIELLGHLGDNQNPFNCYTPAIGEKRFNDATQRLFPKKHWEPSHRLNFYLRLRCGFAHKMRPARGNPGATSVASIDIQLAGPSCPYPHLDENAHRIIVRSDGLYADFERACSKCIELIQRGTYSKPDFDLKTDDFITITQVPIASSVGSSYSTTAGLSS